MHELWPHRRAVTAPELLGGSVKTLVATVSTQLFPWLSLASLTTLQVLCLNVCFNKLLRGNLPFRDSLQITQTKTGLSQKLITIGKEGEVRL